MAQRSIYIPADVFKRVTESARTQKKSISQVVCDAIRAAIRVETRPVTISTRKK